MTAYEIFLASACFLINNKARETLRERPFGTEGAEDYPQSNFGGYSEETYLFF